MLLPDLRKAVLEANLELVRKGLVLYTFGNASAISRKKSLVVIKPSGVPYDRLKPADLVITDLNGMIVEGQLRPSSDLPTHLILYKSFSSIGGINQQATAIGRFLHDQHYLRKHGKAAYYGQPKEKK